MQREHSIQRAWSSILLSVVSLVSITSAEVSTWPQFRGPNADGVATSGFPEQWDATSNVRWKVAVAGEGWSCPIVWGDRVFLTTAVRTDAGDGSSSGTDDDRGGRRRGQDLRDADYRWDVVCVDVESGLEQWRSTARTGQPPLNRHSSNTYASETPVTDGERVYAYFGMSGLFCFSITGEPLWEKDLGTYEMRAGWGTASSPVLFGEMLFLQIDNEEQSFLVALDAKSGDEIWRVDRDEPSQYSSPIIWQNSERNELVTGGQFCRSYDPQTGELLWQLDLQKGRSSATPLAVGDRLYVGTEFRQQGGPDQGGGYLFAVKAGASGDISLDDDSQSNSAVVWSIERSNLQMASPVLCEGHLYVLERRSSMLHCVDAATGQTAYRQRIPGARAFWASPWTRDGKVYCLDDGGTTFVLAGGPTFQLLDKNVIDEQCWSTPAIADNALFLRTAEHLYCIAE